MKEDDIKFFFRTWVLMMLILLITLKISYQHDLIAAIRAVGVQCNVDYEIEIPKIENINQGE